MGRSYSHLSREQRQVIADSLAIGKLAKDIAVTLSLHISTVYREIERGKNPDTNKYEPEFSESKYQSNLADKGKSPRLEENKEMASVISKLILLYFWFLHTRQGTVRNHLKRGDFNNLPGRKQSQPD